MRKFNSFIKDGLVEQPRLEGTSKDHLAQLLVGKRAWMGLLSTLFHHVLKTPSDVDSTMSPGRLFQQMMVLTVKNFFLMLRSSLSQCNLHPLPFVFSTQLLVKQEPPSSSWTPCKHREHCDEVPQVRRDPTPSIFFKVLQTFDHLPGPPSDPSAPSQITLSLG